MRITRGIKCSGSCTNYYWYEAIESMMMMPQKVSYNSREKERKERREKSRPASYEPKLLPPRGLWEHIYSSTPYLRIPRGTHMPPLGPMRNKLNSGADRHTVHRIRLFHIIPPAMSHGYLCCPKSNEEKRPRPAAETGDGNNTIGRSRAPQFIH